MAAGTIVGLVASPAVMGLAARLASAPLEAPPWVYATTVACTLLAGLAAAAAPALCAVRVDPVEALRGE